MNYNRDIKNLNWYFKQVYKKSMWIQWYFKDEYQYSPKYQFLLYKKALLIKDNGAIIKTACNIGLWNLLTKKEQQDLTTLTDFLIKQLTLIKQADSICNLNNNNSLIRKEMNKNWKNAEKCYQQAGLLLKNKIQKGIKTLKGIYHA